jgi:hypothetical protein
MPELCPVNTLILSLKPTPHNPSLCVCRLSLLEQLLRGCRDAAQLQRQLQDNFPAEAVEEQLREFQDNALRGLGPTTLQVRQPPSFA